MKTKFNVDKNDFILYQGDCLDVMSTAIEPSSIDLIAVDLPYGTTQNKWDIIIPFDIMWACFESVLKEDGVVALTASQPFVSQLVMSNTAWFKYDIIWEKSIGSGQLNIKKRPLVVHEHILIFYKKLGTYNEQKTEGTPYSINRKADYKDGSYGKQKDNSKNNDGFRHAKSVIKISNPRIRNGHPTQKPVELMSYIIKTYSNENDVVLDCCMGAGTTGEACISNYRNFVGIELDKDYYNKAVKKLKAKRMFVPID